MSAVNSAQAQRHAVGSPSLEVESAIAEITPAAVTEEGVELLAWVARQPRTYAEAMAVWQTSCPRHSVWEDALADALIEVKTGGGPAELAAVTLSRRGRAVLAAMRADAV